MFLVLFMLPRYIMIIYWYSYGSSSNQQYIKARVSEMRVSLKSERKCIKKGIPSISLLAMDNPKGTHSYMGPAMKTTIFVFSILVSFPQLYIAYRCKIFFKMINPNSNPFFSDY